MKARIWQSMLPDLTEGEAFLWAAEWYCGFPQKGEGAFLHDYEEELKNEAKEQ